MTNISGSRTQTAASNHVDRVPHYLLLKKLVQSRDNVSDDLQSQLDILQERLFSKQQEFEEALATIASRNSENSDLQHQLIDLEKKLAKQESVSRRLQMEIEDTSRAHQETEAELNRYCDSLQFDCNEKDEEIKYLSTFKEGYDRLDEDFIDQTSALVPTDTNRFNAYQPKETVVATKKEHIVSNLLSTKKFKEQILTVMNTMIEQYDEYLEEQKTDIAKKKILNNPDVLATRKMDREIDQADQELWSVQERFKGAMEEINEELSLLQQHQDMLEEQLATIVEDEQKSKPKGNKKAKPKQKEKAPDEPITLEEIQKMSLDPSDYVNEEYQQDQFIPHERIFSKYSVMLYYSQDAGKNYYIHQDCQYCESCHEKTIACPHKVLGESKIILMPHKVTHIKLKRPSVKIARDVEGELKPPPTASTIPHFSPTKRSAGIKSEKSFGESEKTTPASAMSVTSASKIVQMKTSLQSIFEDYKIRTDTERTIGRKLSLERTMSFYEQFHAYIAWQDECASEEDGYGSVMDNLYQFFGDRYIKDEAKFAAVHDFLSAVVSYSRTHRDLQLFAHSLVGNIDFSACRYILLLCNYIETIDWQDVEDFRAFAGLVYPFIQDEDLESIQMGYVSFSENKISKLHVFEYILYLTLKGREPRIQDLEQQLMQYPSRELGIMNDEEFSEAADHLLQVPDEKLRKALFSETLLLLQTTQADVFHVHVSKLACALAYLQLLEQSHKLDSTIYEHIAQSRPTHEESLGVHGHAVQVDPSIHLINMRDVKNLSFNISRRDKCRKERMEAQNDQTFFE